MADFWKTVLLIAMGYLVGSVPFAYFVGKLRRGGIDIRTVGTRNVGAYNVYRLMGAAPALLATAGDVGKGVLAVKVVELVNTPAAAMHLTALAVVAGHIWSVFLGFRGGTGVAATIGVAGAYAPLQTIAACGVGLIVGLPLRTPPPGILAGLITLNSTMAVTRPASETAVIILVSALVVVAHLLKKLHQIRSGLKKASWKEIL